MLEPTIMAFTYRHLEKEDIAYLRISLYEALFVPDGDEPFDKSIIDSPDISKYADNWGRIGDFGFLVVNSIQKCSDFGIWTCSEIGNKSAAFLASRVQ